MNNECGIKIAGGGESRDWALWLPPILIMAGIFWLSGIPNLTLYDARTLSPEMMRFIEKYTYRIGTQGFFSYVISPHPDYVIHKIGHLCAFGSLGISFYYATAKSRIPAVLLTFLYAAGDEFHQYFVPGRSSRFGDIVLDTLSAAVFVFVVSKIAPKIFPKKNMV